MKKEKITVEKMYELENLRFANNLIELNEVELKYFDLAIKLPKEEINEYLNLYDNSSPKLDELKFIVMLQNKYNESRENIIKRIRQVRLLTKYEKGLEKGKKYLKKHN